MSDNAKRRGISASIFRASEEPIAKADTSVQIDRDVKVTADDWIEPEISLEGLEEIVKHSSILPQCIRAYKSNIAGYGIGITYKEDDQEETTEALAEWNAVQDIVNLFSIEQDTKTIFENIIEAREKFGIAYCEVVRDHSGNVVQLDFIRDTPSIRKTRLLEPCADLTYIYHGQEIKRKKRFRKYKQTINGKTIYFKEFGDPRIMDIRDGKYYPELELQYQANEIIDFPIGTEPYGEVRWIGQIMGCDGARRAEALNNNYFHNGRHTPLAIVIKGGTLTEDSYTKLQQYMNGIRGEAGQHSFLLLEAEATDSDFDTPVPDVELKDMASILQKDELFQDYIDNSRKKMQSAFNLPDLYVGYTADFNRATAQAAMEVTEKQVFQPERKSLAWDINNRLLNGYKLKYVEVELKAPDMTNPDDLYKILTICEKAGGLPPNKAKQIAYDAIGETSENYPDEWGEIPLVISNQKVQAEANANSKAQLTGAASSVVNDELKGKLEAQIDKAQKNHESDEVLAVMKSVRKLLAGMQKDG